MFPVRVSRILDVAFSSIGLLFGSIVAYQMIVGDLGSVILSQLLDITVHCR